MDTGAWWAALTHFLGTHGVSLWECGDAKPSQGPLEPGALRAELCLGGQGTAEGVVNFVPLRIHSSVPIFTWERYYWLDCSLPLWTLLFLHQVASISSLPLFFFTQLCESLCVSLVVENT